ncbi:urease accessory protein UreD [Streptomyces sp. GDS52]|uniref:Urease accessory protein UreD n=1 Tax=Streptomyces cathayae TaxID=3031124 RepID=A0ABY8JZC8_9ACTN|nr:urease accessory protein UreD [Streptomyces sp. HUAS 5]WGD40749.1 urease accessory protein UreD [Streptomyces sp. HUAS 5]
MHSARARLATERDPRRGGGPPRTRVRLLHSDWPLMLRRTLLAERAAVIDWAEREATATGVHLTAGGAGPCGGDRLGLEVRVGAGSTLVLGEVSATVLLPGPHGEESRLHIDIRVEAGGTLVWLPEPVIAAHGCRHRTRIHIALAPGARLLLREEVLCGRYGEQPGAFRQRLRAVVGDRPLYDQELAVGPDAPGWAGPAVTAGHHAIGSVLVVDPAMDLPTSPPAGLRSGGGGAGEGTVMPLAGPGLLVGSLAPDSTTLRRRLDAALDDILTGVLTGRPAEGLSRGPRPVSAPARG